MLFLKEVRVFSDKKLSLKEVFGALSPELSCWFSEGKRFGFGAFSGTFCRARYKQPTTDRYGEKEATR